MESAAIAASPAAAAMVPAVAYETIRSQAAIKNQYSE